jgi:hypothetical protein
VTAPAYDGGWSDEPLPLGGGWDEVSLGEPVEPEPVRPAPEPGTFAEDVERHLPAVLAEDVGLAVEDWRDPEVAARFADDVRTRVLEQVRAQYAPLLEARPEGRVVDATVAPEVSFLASAVTALDALAGAVKAGADEARSIAGEVLSDVKGEKGTRTLKAADPYGPIVLKRTTGSKMSTRDEDLLDVLVASLVGAAEDEDDAAARNPVWAVYYARGLRDGLAALLSLTSSPSWKSTALDALAKQLEEREEHALAIRLQHAYGRVDSGSPRITVERTEVKA